MQALLRTIELEYVVKDILYDITYLPSLREYMHSKTGYASYRYTCINECRSNVSSSSLGTYPVRYL